MTPQLDLSLKKKLSLASRQHRNSQLRLSHEATTRFADSVVLKTSWEFTGLTGLIHLSHDAQRTAHARTHARVTLWLLSILLIDPYRGCAALKLLSLLTRFTRESASSSGLTASLLFWEATACTSTRKQNREQRITGLNTQPFSQAALHLTTYK